MLLQLPLLAVTILGVVWMVVGLLAMFTGLSIVVLSLTWLERKALGRLQLRLGPTRTGKFWPLTADCRRGQADTEGRCHPHRFGPGNILGSPGHSCPVGVYDMGYHPGS